MRTRRVGRRPTTTRSEGEVHASDIMDWANTMRSPWEDTLRSSGRRPTSATMPTSERLAAERAKVPPLLRALCTLPSWHVHDSTAEPMPM